MLHRLLGSSGIFVSTIGFGAWGIGGRTAGATSYGDTDDAVSKRALASALDHGITLYDTANVYGDGHSEALIGEVFQRRRDRVVIATKAGMLPSFSGFDFSPKAIRASLEGSLRRLKTDYVDVLQLHNAPPAELLTHPEILNLLRQLRTEGKIRTWGFSTKSPDEALTMLSIPETACLQVNCNLLDWRGKDNQLFERAAEAGVALIARTPLAFGFLSGTISRDTVFDAADHRSLWSRTKIAAWVDAAEAVCAAAGDGTDPVSRIQTALRFCLSFKAVTTVIPGMLTPAEVAANAPAGDLSVLIAEHMQRIERAYRQHESKLVG